MAARGQRPLIAVAVDDVLHDLLAVLGTTDEGGASEPLPAPSRRRLVARALDVLHATPDEPVSVASVCGALGVSERTLQRAFQDCFGHELENVSASGNAECTAPSSPKATDGRSPTSR